MVCQTIYISMLGAEVLHERYCAKNGHPEHTEVCVDGEWKAKN